VTVTTAATGAAAPAVGGTVAIASVADLKECAKRLNRVVVVDACNGVARKKISAGLELDDDREK
jgi:hypothetical protein